MKNKAKIKKSKSKFKEEEINTDEEK